MTSIRTYTIIFGGLMLLSTTQAALEFVGLLEAQYWIAFAVIIGLSIAKAVTVAGWYMHLREEPRAITYLALVGVLGVVALTAGAGYSIL
jgi:cytochrome c oxidase subunit 4